MNACFLKLSYFCGILSFFYWFFIKPSIILHPITAFPELHLGGPVGVHLLDPDTKMPVKPAYFMLDPHDEPIFVDLFTNETFGTTYQYTGRWAKAKAFMQIRLTSPAYGCQRLFDYLRHKENAMNASHPMAQLIWSNRRQSWWPRLKEQYDQLELSYT
jgi:hypothetical protein